MNGSTVGTGGGRVGGECGLGPVGQYLSGWLSQGVRRPQLRHDGHDGSTFRALLLRMDLQGGVWQSQ